MGQPLVHSQRLGSLVGASSWTLVKDEQDGAFARVLWIGLAQWAGPFRLGCVHPFFYLGLSSFYSIFGPTKMTHIAMSFHPSWTLIISKYFGVLTNICYGTLGNEL